MAAIGDSGAVAKLESAKQGTGSAGGFQGPGSPGGLDETPGRTTDRLLHDWRRAHKRCAVYLSQLGFPEADATLIAGEAIARAVSRESWEADGDAYSEALRAMREIIVERYAEDMATRHGIDAFTAWRAAVAAGNAGDRNPAILDGSMPSIKRGSMPRAELERRFFRPQTETLSADEELHRDGDDPRHDKPGE